MPPRLPSLSTDSCTRPLRALSAPPTLPALLSPSVPLLSFSRRSPRPPLSAPAALCAALCVAPSLRAALPPRPHTTHRPLPPRRSRHAALSAAAAARAHLQRLSLSTALSLCAVTDPLPTPPRRTLLSVVGKAGPMHLPPRRLPQRPPQRPQRYVPPPPPPRRCLSPSRALPPPSLSPRSSLRAAHSSRVALAPHPPRPRCPLPPTPHSATSLHFRCHRRSPLRVRRPPHLRPYPPRRL